MTLLVDSNEHRNHPDLTLLLEQSLEVQVGNFNQDSTGGVTYPDFTISGGEQLVGINRKTCGEWLSDSDKVIEQVQRELAGPCEQLALLIEGVMRPVGSAGMLAYSLNWNAETYWGDGNRGRVDFTRRTYAVNPKHAQNQQTRLEWLGVQVVHTYDIRDTASKLIAFHDLVMKNEPNRVLDRLIAQTFHIQAIDPIERAFAETIMGVKGAGWGEELALTVAALGFQTVGDLFRAWDTGFQLCDTMVREKTGVRPRRIGDAKELQLQKALGYRYERASTSDTDLQTREQAQEPDTQVSQVSHP